MLLHFRTLRLSVLQKLNRNHLDILKELPNITPQKLKVNYFLIARFIKRNVKATIWQIKFSKISLFTRLFDLINSFNATGLFLCPLKTESQRLFDVFKGYR